MRLQRPGRTVAIGRLIATAAFLSAAACHSDRPVPPWHQETGYRWRDLDVPAGEAGFTHMEGRASGISFQNEAPDTILYGNRILAQGAGVAIGDVDGDGRPDIFFAKTQGCSSLYRNLGNWKFEDITKSAGVGACDRHTSGVAFADVDGDGDLDLVLVATTGPNAIFINDGKGHFTEHRDLGLDTAGRGGTTIAMSDVDGDGFLDLYVANYKAYYPSDTIPPQERSFQQLVRQVGPGVYDVVPEHQKDYKLVNRPDMGGMNMTMRGEPDEFYHNDHGRFVREPLTGARFENSKGRPLTEEAESFTLGAKLVDLNGDGWPDLYVANDFEDPDQFFLNDGKGNFRLADWTAQRQISNSSMGVDVGDVNGDGIPDIFETDMLANDSRRLKTQMPTHTALPKKPGDVETQLQQQRNTLFINRGDGTFAEVGALAGVSASGWSWSTMMIDVDLDGWQDILIANGHPWDVMDADTQERLQNRLTNVVWRKERWQYPKLPLKSVAYRNRGDLTFEDVSDKWKFASGDAISHAMASGDLDGDGDLDVVVNRLGSPALVLRNDASAPRVAVRLIGDKPNTMAVGSKIILRDGAVPLQEREVEVGGLYLSHSDFEASFAMGKSQRATLEIDWRDGRRTVLNDVKPNRLYEITQSTAVAAQHSDTAVRSAPLFEDATPLLGGHTHVDSAFDDWERQFLLPNSLSQLGPGVAWFDYDRDGHEDLIVGSGKGGRLGVFHNDGHRVVPQPSQGPIAEADLTGIVGFVEGNHTRLLAGMSSWENAPNVSPVINVSASAAGVSTKVDAIFPADPSSTGPIAMADYDGDGRLDLFVGGRAVPGNYPEPATSTLYVNRNGTFIRDETNNPLLKNVGLVSAATFADVNGDGHPDLILAREWNSILLLLNDGHGHFTRAPASWGLDKWTSRWNGIAVGDLDGDGRLDFVATSWGRNTFTPTDSTRPLTAVYGKIGTSGEEEVILARQDPRLNALAPLNSYPRMRVAIVGLATRVTSFGEYADATLDKIIEPVKDKAKQQSIVTLDNMVFLNRGDHFEARPLPVEAQFAPAFYAGIADFDGDGKEDVFLSENFYPTAVGIPRYDEGRSLLLKGDGKGGLRALSGKESGIVVYGDQRGAAYADYDGDGRLDIAVSQNASATRLFHNKTAKPGLRVRLKGPATNPDGVGAQIRVVYGSQMGPVREVQAGSGYWSQNGAVQVLGLSGPPTEVWVRWPGGKETRTRVAPGTHEIVLQQ